MPRQPDRPARATACSQRTVSGPVRRGAAHEAARQAPRARRHRADRPPRHRPRLRRGADRRGRRPPCSTAAPSSTRHLPEPRARSCSSKPGILLVDLPDDALFELLSDGDPIVVVADGPAERMPARCCAGESCSPAARCSTSERVRADTEARRREIGEALERFAHNTIEHMREERELLAGRHRAAALRDRLPRPLDARRRARRRPPARPARAAAVHPRHAPGDRRRRRRRRGAARGGPQAGHDRRRHGLGRRGGAALRRRARRALPTPTAARPGRERLEELGPRPSSSSPRRAPARTSRC